MMRMPLLSEVNSGATYAADAGVGAGAAAAGFEAHVCFSHRGGGDSGADFTDAGLLACGNGAQGWALSMDYAADRGAATFRATIGDTGGPAVSIESEEQVWSFGKLCLLSLVVLPGGALFGLYLNGMPLVLGGATVGVYSPDATSFLEFGAVTYGLVPNDDTSFFGAAFQTAPGANDAAVNIAMAHRAMAVQQNQRMVSRPFWANRTNGIAFTEYSLAWDAVSLAQSGPTTTLGAERNLPVNTWLPRSGTENLTAQLGEADPSWNLIHYENVDWFQPTVIIPAV